MGTLRIESARTKRRVHRSLDSMLKIASLITVLAACGQAWVLPNKQYVQYQLLSNGYRRYSPFAWNYYYRYPFNTQYPINPIFEPTCKSVTTYNTKRGSIGT